MRDLSETTDDVHPVDVLAEAGVLAGQLYTYLARSVRDIKSVSEKYGCGHLRDRKVLEVTGELAAALEHLVDDLDQLEDNYSQQQQLKEAS